MSSKRSSYEAGHKRKYLVVIDDTEECDRAVYWAAKRAGRTKSQIVMLRVIEPGDRNQQWLGVADIMKAEQQEAANATLDKFAERGKKNCAHHARPRHSRRRYGRRDRQADRRRRRHRHPCARGRHREGRARPIGLQPCQDRRHFPDSGGARAWPSERRGHRREFLVPGGPDWR